MSRRAVLTRFYPGELREFVEVGEAQSPSH